MVNELPVDLDLPADWEITRPGEGGINLIARPPGWDGAFVPSITVTHTRIDPPLPFDAYVDQQLAGVVATFSDARLVDLGIEDDDHTLDLTLAIDANGLDATTTQRHLYDAGGIAVVATGIAADIDWPEVAQLLVDTVRTLRATR